MRTPALDCLNVASGLQESSCAQRKRGFLRGSWARDESDERLARSCVFAGPKVEAEGNTCAAFTCTTYRRTCASRTSFHQFDHLVTAAAGILAREGDLRGVNPEADDGITRAVAPLSLGGAPRAR